MAEGGQQLSVMLLLAVRDQKTITILGSTVEGHRAGCHHAGSSQSLSVCRFAKSLELLHGFRSSYRSRERHLAAAEPAHPTSPNRILHYRPALAIAPSFLP